MPATVLVENFDCFLKFKHKRDDQKNSMYKLQAGISTLVLFLLLIIKSNETLSLYIIIQQFGCL